jgi:hypothetical protein
VRRINRIAINWRMWPLEVRTDDGLRIRAAGPAAFLRGIRHDIMSVWCKKGADVWVENGSKGCRHPAKIKAEVGEGDDDVLIAWSSTGAIKTVPKSTVHQHCVDGGRGSRSRHPPEWLRVGDGQSAAGEGNEAKKRALSVAMGVIPKHLTFTLPAPAENVGWVTRELPGYKNGLPEVPVRAVHCLDEHRNSGLQLWYSNHLGVERLVPYAIMTFPVDCKDKEGNFDERRALELARWMGAGRVAYEDAVTSPVPPEIMKLKPGEAAFNTEKHADAANALLSHGIITDTGKTVQLGYHPKFPICMIHAPQTDNAKDIEEMFKEYHAYRKRLRRIEATKLPRDSSI